MIKPIQPSKPGLPPHKGLVDASALYPIPKPTKIYPAPMRSTQSQNNKLQIDAEVHKPLQQESASTDNVISVEATTLASNKLPIKSKDNRELADKHNSINILEPIIGGEVEPDEPSKIDMGDHTIESLDYNDYDSE